jgi:hypothetical protein
MAEQIALYEQLNGREQAGAGCLAPGNPDRESRPAHFPLANRDNSLK